MMNVAFLYRILNVLLLITLAQEKELRADEESLDISDVKILVDKLRKEYEYELRKEYDIKLETLTTRLEKYELKLYQYEKEISIDKERIKALETRIKFDDSTVRRVTNKMHTYAPNKNRPTTKERVKTIYEKNKKMERNINGKLTDDVLRGVSKVRNFEKSSLTSSIERVPYRATADEQIAFYAQLSHSLDGLGTHQTIVFDHVVTNIGNGYNHNDGEFTVPVSGVYVLIWTTANWDHTYMISSLVVNAVAKATALSDSDDHSDLSSATGVAVLSINAGDTVWIRTESNHRGPLSGGFYCYFAGWLLH